MNNKPIGILGYGRFGRLMMQMLENDTDMFFYDIDPNLQQEKKFKPLAELLTLPTLILAVPISHLEKTLQTITPQLQTQTVIDVCSVKLYPSELMQQYLPKHINLLATHPMFGPDSFTTKAAKNMMMYPLRMAAGLFEQWCEYFTSKNLHVSIMTPDQHDREIAFSQNLTHYIGRILGELNLQDSKIATAGYRSLLKIVQQTCNDSWEFFHDMLQYNPYSQKMMTQLTTATETVVAKLNLDNGDNKYGN